MSELDWQSVEDYAFTAELDGAGWAWEFLRRNPEYKIDWLAACDAQKQFEKIQSGNHPNIDKNAYAYFIPALPDGMSPSAWFLSEGVKRYSPAIGYGKKWRLNGRIQDPSCPTAPLFEKVTSATLLDYESASQYYSAVAEDSDFLIQTGSVAVIAIDLTQPIDSVRDSLKSIIRHERKKRGIGTTQTHSAKRENWVNFLRILDAKKCSIPHSKIGQIVFPNLAEDDVKSKVSTFINAEIPRLFDPDALVHLANT